MRYLLLALIALCLTLPAVAQQLPGDPGPSHWSGKPLLTTPDTFRFAIIGDLYSEYVPGIFEKAVNDLNALQPEFVLSVGDLVPGYSRDAAKITAMYDEFDRLLAPLKMPFYYVPGNHDLSNPAMIKVYSERHGQPYNYFIYKNVLFLCVDTEDPQEKERMSDAQVAYFQKVLAENTKVRWTLLFMHEPLWLYNSANWKKMETALQGRPHTVFAGHYHTFTNYPRNGQQYYTLSCTANGAKLPERGNFDALVWVTMTEKGPLLAQMPVGGIRDGNYYTEADEQALSKLNVNIACDPLHLRGSIYRPQRTIIHLTNDTDGVAHFTARFRPDARLAAIPGVLEMDVPKGKKDISVEFYCTAPLPDDHTLGLTMETTVSLTMPSGKVVPFGNAEQRVPIVTTWPIRKGKPVVVDGKLNEWKSLPFTLDTPGEVTADPAYANTPWTGPQESTCRFGVRYDDKFVYVAMEAKDKTVFSDPTKPPWYQDGLDIRFNASADPWRTIYDGGDFYVNLLLPFSPGDTADKTVFLYAKQAPKDFKVACVKTPAGYNAEVAIPVAYLEEKQSKPWTAFRMNVALNDHTPGGGQNRVWWMPNWSGEKNYPGSGTFVRE
jgi:hypothetical protein